MLLSYSKPVLTSFYRDIVPMIGKEYPNDLGPYSNILLLSQKKMGPKKRTMLLVILPDITPLDLFLWRYLKSKVYANRCITSEDLKERIRFEIQIITV